MILYLKDNPGSKMKLLAPRPTQVKVGNLALGLM